MKNQEKAEELVKVTGQVYLRPVLTDAQVNIACVTSDPKKSASTDATTTTVAGASTTTAASDAPTKVENVAAQTHLATATAAAAPTTTVASDAPTTTAPGGATTTTVAGDTTGTLPAVPPEETGFLPARGGSICKVGPAGGTGEVFQDDATARILSGSGWGVTVSLRGGSKGEDVWNVLASECFNATATCPKCCKFRRSKSANSASPRNSCRSTGAFSKPFTSARLP